MKVQYESRKKPIDQIALAMWQQQMQMTRQRPWLASLHLKQAKQRVERFAYFYRQLLSLPHRWQRYVKRGLVTGLLGASLLLSWSHIPSVHAATISVTPAASGINAGDGCSLVEAIINANNNAATHADCATGAGAMDTIMLAGNTYTYNMAYGSSSALPNITSPLTIEGNGATIERDSSAPHFRLLNVNAGSDFVLNDTTLSGGLSSNQSGGAILHTGGDLTLNNTVVRDNETDGYSAAGVFSVNGSVTINGSTFEDNRAAYGAGGLQILNGAATISGTTISDNNGSGNDGVAFSGTTLSIDNSTISGNSGDGVDVSGGGGAVITINNSTITGNLGGGISASGGTFNLNQTIVSGNGSGGTGQELQAPSATINASYTLFGHGGLSDAQAFNGFAPAGNNINASSDGLNIPLSNILDTTLQNNGGATKTHALVNGSPAVDVSPTGLATDQPGVARPLGMRFDLGAVESSYAVPAEVTINGSQCFLADAIRAANNDTATVACAAGNAGADTISLLRDVVLLNNAYYGTGLPAITSEIIIEGNGATIERDSNAPDFRLLRVSAGGDLTLNDTMLTGGVTNGAGGAIFQNGGSLTLNNAVVRDNESIDIDSAGIFSSHGSLTIHNSTIEGNRASYGAGGVHTRNGTATISGSTISGNDGNANVGIVISESAVTIDNSTISGNSGDGIVMANGSSSAVVTINNSTITGNLERGIHVSRGTLNLNQTLVSGNGSGGTGQELAVGYLGTVNASYSLFAHAGLSNFKAFIGFTPAGNNLNASNDGLNIALSNILDTTLQNNGGATKTHALVGGSPAAHASPTGLATDQRGELRPFGINYDIGAVEYIPLNRKVTLNGTNPAVIAFTSGLSLWHSSDPYGSYSQVAATNGKYHHPNPTAAPSYWQLRTPAGTVIDSFGIFPFMIVPGS
ncbi:MAG: right-handed parallel beta-helix repeat-containing protein [Chloroflexota bacterium]